MSNKEEQEEEEHKLLDYTGWEELPVATISLPGEAEYAVTGHESQVLTITLPQPGQHVQAAPGTMMYLSTGITQQISCTEGFCARCVSGESCCVMNFLHHDHHHHHHRGSTLQQQQAAHVALTPTFPTAKVVPINLSDVGGTLLCQPGSYMASFGDDVQVGVSCDCNFLRCCCGGFGMVRQKIYGSGTVFLAAVGTILQKVLQPGETLVVDTHCVLAFADTCALDVRRVGGGILGILGSGQGLYNTTLTGPGIVLAQSINEKTFLHALAANKMYRR